MQNFCKILINMMLIVFIAIYSAQNAILKKPTELFFGILKIYQTNLNCVCILKMFHYKKKLSKPNNLDHFNSHWHFVCLLEFHFKRQFNSKWIHFVRIDAFDDEVLFPFSQIRLNCIQHLQFRSHAQNKITKIKLVELPLEP